MRPTTKRIETRQDERTGVDVPYLVTEYEDDTPMPEVIQGAATGMNYSLLRNRERLAVPGDLNSEQIPAVEREDDGSHD